VNAAPVVPSLSAASPGSHVPAWPAVQRIARSGLAWGVSVSVLVSVGILFGIGGLDYYRTRLAVRGYEPLHSLLRPSGPVGQSLGIVGAILLLVPFAYMARKRMRWLKPVGSAPLWLEIHLFCGIVGPVLITFHTSFKFNGIVSAAYWSMVLVVASGFVGRFLYVRIPRSIRGTEMTRAELDQEAAVLSEDLDRLVAPGPALSAVRTLEREVVPEAARVSWADLFLGEVRMGRRLHALESELRRLDIDDDLRRNLVTVTERRSMLLRRALYLQKTKKLFDLWHVFHLPLVYLLLVIAAAHVAVVVYLGYVPFRW
jgi:hypothetical protein